MFTVYCKKLKFVYIKEYNQEEEYVTSINKILEDSGEKLEVLLLRGYFTLTELTIKKMVNLKELYMDQSPSYLTSENLITLAQNCKLETLHTTVLCDANTNSAFEMFLQAMGGKMKDLNIRHDSYFGVLLSWTKYLSFCQSLENVHINVSTHTSPVNLNA